MKKMKKIIKKTEGFFNIFLAEPGQEIVLVRKCKGKLSWAWPNGSGEEIPKKALPESGQIMALVRKSKRTPCPELASRPPPPQSSQSSIQTARPARQAARPAGQPARPGILPSISSFSDFNQMKNEKN